MKVRALHIVRVLLALLFFAGVGFILHFSSEERASKVCTGISVEFSDSLKFVSQDDIKNYISSNYGAVTGQRLDSVKLDMLERLLESKSAILDGRGRSPSHHPFPEGPGTEVQQRGKRLLHRQERLCLPSSQELYRRRARNLRQCTEDAGQKLQGPCPGRA